MKQIKSKSFAIATGALLLSGSMAAKEKPNILIIHTDEHNIRTLNCYRKYMSQDQAFPWGAGANVETPNIDYLADNGVLFFKCYAASPVSSPSRASFLTGMYPQNVNMHTNDMLLSEQPETFGETLRNHGYKTGYFGKLHLNGKDRPGWHPERDFGFEDNRYMYNRGHWKKIVETEGNAEFRQLDPVTTTDSVSFTTDYLVNKAIGFIKQNNSKPFCCLVALPDPHGPNQVRSPYSDMFRNLTVQKPLTAKKDTTGLPAWSYGTDHIEDQMEDMTQYFGMIKCIDDNVKRLLDTLRELDILDNTLIIFTSDHGDMCGQHGLVNKSVPLEDSSRVPFIVSYPKRLPSGLVNNNVVSVVDFTPSLLSFCGINTHWPYEGRDISGLWKGKKLTSAVKDQVFMRAPTTTMLESDWDESRTAHRFLWVSVVTPRYKLIYSENPSDVPWLTDLSKDPDELVNCYYKSEYAKVVTELTKELVGYGKKHKDERLKNPKIKNEIDLILSE